MITKADILTSLYEIEAYYRTNCSKAEEAEETHTSRGRWAKAKACNADYWRVGLKLVRALIDHHEGSE